jgi:nicotinate dehydrogenase subunit A
MGNVPQPQSVDTAARRSGQSAPMPERITLNVNGRMHQVQVEPDTPLLYVLRNDLGLNAAKFGCGLEQCGACKVIVDGEAVFSCRSPVESFVGRRITTLEGVGTAAHLHPLQRAFIEEQAAQCGYCIPGIIIAAKALLDRNPRPTDAEIREALAMHLCRCGTHARIIKAVRRAALEMAE